MLQSNQPINQNPLFNPFLSSLPRKRNRQSQSEHDLVLEQYATYFHNKGLYVRADHISWIHGKPEQVGMHYPDIAVYDNTGITNIEIETADSFLESHSISQYRALNQSKKAWVVLVVPKGYDQFKLENDIHKFQRLNLQYIKLEICNL